MHETKRLDVSETIVMVAEAEGRGRAEGGLGGRGLSPNRAAGAQRGVR